MDSIRALDERVSCLISRGQLNTGLKLIYNHVEKIITEPICTSWVYGSKTLDNLCQRIGAVNFKKIRREKIEKSNNYSTKSIVVYVVTKIQRSGGHTRVIESFIKSQRGVHHVILSTELDGKSDVEYFDSLISKQADVALELSENNSFQQRLTWLQKRLVELAPRNIYLFNHHHDSVAVAAIQPEMNLDATFYHHGDHHLCLGVHLSHLKHIDPHPMGYHNCRGELGINNIYVPLTAEDNGPRPTNLAFMASGRLTTCTAARSNKIEIPYFVSYLDLVPRLLMATGGTHVHIGRLTPWALYKIRRGLRFYGVEYDRFIYIQWVPSVWKALHDNGVDLYVASFPYGGALTLIEAMGAGIPVALHRHMFSRMLSCIDLAYPGAFNWRQPEELLEYCASVTVDDLRAAGEAGRTQFTKFHSDENLDYFFNDENAHSAIPDPLFGKFSVETDEWAIWMESQLSLPRLIGRTAYRAYRRFRRGAQ